MKSRNPNSKRTLVVAILAAHAALLPQLIRQASAADSEQDQAASDVQNAGGEEADVGASRGGSGGGGGGGRTGGFSMGGRTGGSLGSGGSTYHSSPVETPKSSGGGFMKSYDSGTRSYDKPSTSTTTPSVTKPAEKSGGFMPKYDSGVRSYDTKPATSSPSLASKPELVGSGKFNGGQKVDMYKHTDSTGREHFQLRDSATGQSIKTPVDANGNKMRLNDRGQWLDGNNRTVAKPMSTQNTNAWSASSMQAARSSGYVPPVQNTRESLHTQSTKYVNTTVINNTTIVNNRGYYDHYYPGHGSSFVAGMVVGAALASPGLGYGPYYHPYYYHSIYVPSYMPVYSCGGIFGWCGGYYYPNPYLGAMDAAIAINLAVSNSYANANAAAANANAAAANAAANRAEDAAALANQRAAMAEEKLNQMIKDGKFAEDKDGSQVAAIRKALADLNKSGNFKNGDVVKLPKDMQVTLTADRSVKDKDGNEIGFKAGDKCNAVFHGSAEIASISNGKATLVYTAPEAPNDPYECVSGLTFELPVEDLAKMNQEFMANVAEHAKDAAKNGDTEQDRLANRAAAMAAERARRAAESSHGAATGAESDNRVKPGADAGIGASPSGVPSATNAQ